MHWCVCAGAGQAVGAVGEGAPRWGTEGQGAAEDLPGSQWIRSSGWGWWRAIGLTRKCPQGLGWWGDGSQGSAASPQGAWAEDCLSWS